MRLPNLIIAGERRCGTTFLSQRLAVHPEIFVHPKRDRGYFIDDDARKGGTVAPWAENHGVDDYTAFIDAGTVGAASIVCEKSADYLYWRPAHARMAAMLPAAKYVVVLRHPVRRAWSHYWNEVGKKREAADFETAVERDLEDRNGDPYSRNHLSFARRGYYDESVADFQATIGADKVFVLVLEELMADEAAALRPLYAFLGIAEHPLPVVAEHQKNRNWAMLRKPWAQRGIAGALAQAHGTAVDAGLKLAMSNRDKRRRAAVALKAPFFQSADTVALDQRLADRLAEIYVPHVRALERLLDRSFDVWGL